MLYEKERVASEINEIPDFAMQPAQELNTVKEERAKQYDDSAYNTLLGKVQQTLGEPKVQEVVTQAEGEKVEVSAFQEAEAFEIQLPEDIENQNVEVFEAKIIEGFETQDVEVFEPQMAEPTELQAVETPVEIPFEKTVKIIPIAQNIISSKLKVKDIKDAGKVRIYVEEDVLVPDVKPDLLEILSMDGKIKLAEREILVGQNGAETIRVSGELVLQTLYIPEDMNSGDSMVSIESRVPFKSDYNVGASPESQIVLRPVTESIEFTRINERKFKVKATLMLSAKEYQNIQINIFEGINDVDVQMLKEKIHLTDIALRKTEEIEVREEMPLKDTQPNIAKILKYDVNLVENNKQILKEKAVINGSIFCNVLYLGCISEEHPTPEPTLYQGRSDFTHFIKLNLDGNQGEDSAGGKSTFNMKNFSLTAKENEGGSSNTFCLEADIETTVEIYKNVEREVVTDIYHSQKEMNYETEDLCLRTISGGGASEVTIREIVAIPEKHGAISKIAYMSAEIKEESSVVDVGRNTIEGNLIAKLICVPEDISQPAFSLIHEIPFRSMVEIPGLTPQMAVEDSLVLKTLWFDKIGDKQVEINASILVNTAASGEERHKIVKSVSMLEGAEMRDIMPGLVLYITKSGDNIWNIAKKFRTTIGNIKEQNDLDYSVKMNPGTKLLIESNPN